MDTAVAYFGYEEHLYGHKQFDAVNIELDPRMWPFLVPIVYDETTKTYHLSFPNSNYGSMTPNIVHEIQNRCLGNPLQLETKDTDDVRHADSNEQDMLLSVGTWDRVSNYTCP